MWMSHGHESLVNESRHTLEPVMIHTWLSYPLRQTCDYVVSHVCMSPVTHVVSRTHWNHDTHDSHFYAEYVWCDSSHVWHEPFTCVTWLFHRCDMTPSHVRHDSLLCVAWLIHVCDMTHSHNGLGIHVHSCVAVCCSVLQCAAVCCSVLQCVAVCCGVLRCVAVCCCIMQCARSHAWLECQSPGSLASRTTFSTYLRSTASEWFGNMPLYAYSTLG